MKRYALMLAAACLISAAPVYYAFQAQAEEATAEAVVTTPTGETTATVKIDCAALAEGTVKPDECKDAAADIAADAAVDAAVEQAPAK